jgi:hypothetical protein
MKKFPFRTPKPPIWKVDWAALTGEFDWIAAMRDCPQDPTFHPEGTVWTHVGMVCEALAAPDEFRALPDSEREVLFAAALLHDVAKPSYTRYDDRRITSRGHSQRGRVVKIVKCVEESQSSMMDVEDEHNHMRAAFGLRYRFGKPGTPAAE